MRVWGGWNSGEEGDTLVLPSGLYTNIDGGNLTAPNSASVLTTLPEVRLSK